MPFYYVDVHKAKAYTQTIKPCKEINKEGHLIIV
jgi:hypothetical protein